MDEMLKFVIEIDGKEYFSLDKINKYTFFSREDKVDDIVVLKDVSRDGEEFYDSLDDVNELNYALKLYFKKNNLEGKKY